MKIAIVLGNRMRDDGTISDVMRERLQLALKLYGEQKPDYMILSGGAPNKKTPVTEASAMYDWLVDAGIDPAVLICEDRSNVTNQNARNSAAIACELGADTVVVCSSRAHLTRRCFNPGRQFARHLKGSGIQLALYMEPPAQDSDEI